MKIKTRSSQNSHFIKQIPAEAERMHSKSVTQIPRYTQIKNTRNENTKSSTSEIHPPFDPHEKPPSFAPSLRLQLVKLKFSIVDPHPPGNTSRPMKKPFKLPTLQFPEQKIITPIKYKVFLNRKQGGLGWASEDVGPLSKLNILSFQNNMEELIRSFHSLLIPPYIVFTGKTFINNEPCPTPHTKFLPNPGY